MLENQRIAVLRVHYQAANEKLQLHFSLYSTVEETQELLHTLSVCSVRLAAGLPTAMSHKITVLSAEALAKTFLIMDKKSVLKLFLQIQTNNGQKSKIHTEPNSENKYTLIYRLFLSSLRDNSLKAILSYK